MNLQEGVLIALERDDAKAFFGQREDQARLAFVAELLSRGDVTAKSLHGKWSALHDALAAIELEQSFLEQCILGGRPLHQGEDHHVMLVRPDVVGFIAEQLAQIEMSSLSGDLAADMEVVVQTYQHAAQQNAAVVFVAER